MSSKILADDVARYEIVPTNAENSENQEKPKKAAKKRRNTDSNSIFSIGFKMVTIVTLIVIVSLGSITALVSWLVRQDLQIAAEDNNFETNRRSSLEAEETLSKMQSDALYFLHTTALLNADNAKNSADYFFAQNPRIAAIGHSTLFANGDFFLKNDIDISLVSSFEETSEAFLNEAALGKTTVVNAAPHFTYHLLAIFFKGETGGAYILFSPENLNTSFGTGVNKSYLINDAGDIIVHSDNENIRKAVNVSDREYVRNIKESSAKSRQSLAETDDGTTQFLAYTKLNTGGCIAITSIEYKKVFEGIEATTRRNIYLTIAILALSVMCIWFFAKSISIPLKMLAFAARKIEGGEFDINLIQKGRDEIGVLTASFQKMTSALHIFGRFTNKEIAIKAMRNQIKPGGLPKHATVFFSDIRGFTAKSESFTNVFGEDAPNRIVHWLNEYFTQMIDCVEKTGGTIDKFIGDAVMAHWGTSYTTGSPQKDAINCVMASLMMRKALYELNKNRKKGDLSDPPITIGCGINTGIVTAGQLGSDQRMEYTVIGDPVNLASRVESLTKALGADILIAEDTYNLVRKFFITEEMPSVTVKGKEKPVRIFAVVGPVGTSKGPQTLAAVRKLLGIETPDLEKTDVNADEKKYKIGEAKK
ncbi:MAG: HAMP domain-containing protein [Treponema sp.]|nr:HAMP domain-containing protein [Treponema sp.]MCL2237411.1 HAMP domain-containing protein [Treponema sp.]